MHIDIPANPEVQNGPPSPINMLTNKKVYQRNLQ